MHIGTKERKRKRKQPKVLFSIYLALLLLWQGYSLTIENNKITTSLFIVGMGFYFRGWRLCGVFQKKKRSSCVRVLGGSFSTSTTVGLSFSATASSLSPRSAVHASFLVSAILTWEYYRAPWPDVGVDVSCPLTIEKWGFCKRIIMSLPFPSQNLEVLLRCDARIIDTVPTYLARSGFHSEEVPFQIHSRLERRFFFFDRSAVFRFLRRLPQDPTPVHEFWFPQLHERVPWHGFGAENLDVPFPSWLGTLPFCLEWTLAL